MSIHSVICLRITFLTCVLTLPSPPRVNYLPDNNSSLFFKGVADIPQLWSWSKVYSVLKANTLLYLDTLYLADIVTRTSWESFLWWTSSSDFIDRALYKAKYTTVLLEIHVRRTHWLWTCVLSVISVSVEKKDKQGAESFYTIERKLEDFI